MTSAINCFTELEILAQGNKPPAVPDERESDLQHPLAHPCELLQKFTGGSIVERRIENSVLPIFKRHRPGERIGEQVRLVRKVFAVLPHHAVQVRRRHHEDGRCRSTHAAGERRGLMCARVNAPLSKHLFRSIADPLSHVQSSREGRRVVAQISIQIAGQYRPAAVRVADEQRRAVTPSAHVIRICHARARPF